MTLWSCGVWMYKHGEMSKIDTIQKWYPGYPKIRNNIMLDFEKIKTDLKLILIVKRHRVLTLVLMVQCN